MIAIRLHVKKNPHLNKGCFLIPVFNWDKDSTVVNDWVKTLNRYNRGRPNHNINYITLVSIPDDFPVFVAYDWIVKNFYPKHKIPVMSLKEWVQDTKEIASKERWLPEIVLGKKLPSKYIKWTKDYKKFRKRN